MYMATLLEYIAILLVCLSIFCVCFVLVNNSDLGSFGVADRDLTTLVYC